MFWPDFRFTTSGLLWVIPLEREFQKEYVRVISLGGGLMIEPLESGEARRRRTFSKLFRLDGSSFDYSKHMLGL